MSTEGRAVMTVPTRSLALPRTMLDDDSFMHELVAFICIATVDQAASAMSTTYKNKTELKEERDSVSPYLVTELLTTIMEPYASRSDITPVKKHVRDNVEWKTSEIPWRRSGLWFVIRVSIQLAFTNATQIKDSQAMYKNFVMFCVSRIARIASEQELPADILFVLNAKLAKRASKLGNSLFVSIATHSHESTRQLSQQMSEKWRTVHAYSGSKIDLLRGATTADTELTLSSSCSYLSRAMLRANAIDMLSDSRNTYSSVCRFHGQPDTLPSPIIFGPQTFDDDIIVLADFERWVEQDLGRWQSVAPEEEDTCIALKDLIEAYHLKAARIYEGCPELLSQMALVVIELWITLDAVTTRMLPLLRKYQTEISKSMLESLLLRKRAQVDRLQKVESYLRWRNSANVHGDLSIFGDLAEESFSAKFYETDPEFSSIRDSIQQTAHRAKTRKLEEFERASSRFESLREEARLLPHVFVVNQEGEDVHAPWKCDKCKLNREAFGMRIDIYEWPLPKEEHLVRTVIFELLCPPAFTAFRDCTWYVLHDVAQSLTSSYAVVEETVHTYTALSRYVRSTEGRVALGSDEKPLARTHLRHSNSPWKVQRQRSSEILCVTRFWTNKNK